MKIATFLVLLALLAASSIAATDCLDCHRAKPPAGMEAATDFDSETFERSVHSNLACTDCHNIDPAKKHKGMVAVDCGSCHEDARVGFDKSPHAKAANKQGEKLPNCVTCHTGHAVLPVSDTNSRTFHQNSVKICIECHEDQSLTEQIEKMPKPEMIISYEHSVHGRALKEGNDAAPACVDCHGSHTTMPSDDPGSPVYKTHIAQTCGKCHTEISAVYSESVHGRTLAEGVTESPTCTDCHGEHNILQPDDPQSSVNPLNVVKTCSECHGSEVIVGKFGLKADRINTFKESFHGVALELDNPEAANCASCHGVHAIFPQSDPRSLINSANIESTCGKCHEGLPADFAKGTFHESAEDPGSGGQFFVRKFYWWFITIIIVGFLIYRILEYKRRVNRTE